MAVINLANKCTLESKSLLEITHLFPYAVIDLLCALSLNQITYIRFFNYRTFLEWRAHLFLINYSRTYIIDIRFSTIFTFPNHSSFVWETSVEIMSACIISCPRSLFECTCFVIELFNVIFSVVTPFVISYLEQIISLSRSLVLFQT